MSDDIAFLDPESASIPELSSTESGWGISDSATGIPYVPTEPSAADWTQGGTITDVGPDGEGAFTGSGAGGDMTGTGGGSGTPVNVGGGTAGGAFSSVGQQGSALWKGIGGVLNPISTALTGKPLISTSTPMNAASAQQQTMQNMLVVGVIGLGAWLLLKKA